MGKVHVKVVVKPNGDRIYIQDNKVHRMYGPAIEFADGRKHYYHYGKRIDIDGKRPEGMLDPLGRFKVKK